MAYTRPTDYLNWAIGNPSVISEPTTPQKFAGFVPNQRPASQVINYIFNNLSEWQLWLDQVTQLNLSQNQFDAVIGTNGTHADINSFNNDSNYPSPANVLITTPQTLAAVQTVTRSDVNFWFKPEAVFSIGAGGGTGILIQGNRVRLIGGRFYGFTTSAITLDTSSKNCIVRDNFFNTCTASITDNGSNNTLTANVEEV